MNQHKFKADSNLTALSLATGLSLIPLLPIGLFWGVKTPIFTLFFLIHIVIILSALSRATCRLLFDSNSHILPRLGICLCLIWIALEGALPIVARDALIHHLAVPKWWLESGKIYEIPWHEWSYYPMLLNLGFLGLLRFHLEILTPYYHACFLILLCALTSIFVARKTGSASLGTFSAFVLLSIPVALRLASTPLVDLGLALYCALALYEAAEWYEHRSSRRIIAVGLALGLALSIKFNGLLAAALFFAAFFMILQGRLSDFKVSIKALTVVGLVSTLIYSPWLIKNYAWTGNPIYPLYKSYFTAQTPQVSLPRGMSPLELRVRLYQESWGEILALPLRIFLQGEDDNPRLFDGRLSPLLLFFVLGIFVLRKESWARLFSIYALGYLLFALILSGARVRYLAPVYGPLSVLTVCSMWELLKRAPSNTARYVWSTLGMVQFLWFIQYSTQTTHASYLKEFFTGSLSREAYLTQVIPEFPMIQQINQTLPDSSRVYLLLTGNRFYYYDKPVISAGHYSGNELVTWIKTSPTTQSLLEKFTSRGVTHLLAHAGRTREALNNALNNEERMIWNDFSSSRLQELGSENDYVLWELHS